MVGIQLKYDVAAAKFYFILLVLNVGLGPHPPLLMTSLAYKLPPKHPPKVPPFRLRPKPKPPSPPISMSNNPPPSIVELPPPPMSQPIVMPNPLPPPILQQPPPSPPVVRSKPPIRRPPVESPRPVVMPPPVLNPPSPPTVVPQPPIVTPSPSPPIVVRIAPPPVDMPSPPIVEMPPPVLNAPSPPTVVPETPPIVTPSPSPPVDMPSPPPFPITDPTPSPAQMMCPIDTLKLGGCVDFLGEIEGIIIGIGIGGNNTKETCCPILEGLIDLDAALCLCSTIKAKLLNIDIILPLALQVLAECGKNLPPGYTCPAGIGHLASMLELAKHLIERDERFSSITVLLMMPLNFNSNYSTYIDSLISYTTPLIRFVHLPPCCSDSLSTLDINNQAPETLVSLFIEAYKLQIKQTIITDVINGNTDSSVHFAGLVIDLFCTTIIDVGNELGLPTYIYFTSTAAMLSLMLHLPVLDTQIQSEFTDLETDLRIPCFTNSVPPLVLPSPALNKKDDSYRWTRWYLYHGQRFMETKGIMVNSFHDLEPHALDSFLSPRQGNQIQIQINPPVYAVGPLLDLKGQTQLQPDQTHHGKIMKWLDEQPPTSVILLCFGSMGSFSEQQVREIANGLETSGYRFLWSLRKPPKDKLSMPTDYTDHEEVEVLPEGFLERTKGKGLVCGWVSQVAVLGHQSIGGFVSHCGWNSVLESLWFGVPIVTWPLYAEQQLNAFELVRELGLAVELRLDSRIGDDVVVVGGDEIERALRNVMEESEDNQVRRKVKEMSEKGRKAVLDKSGSSFVSLGHLFIVHDVLHRARLVLLGIGLNEETKTKTSP